MTAHPSTEQLSAWVDDGLPNDERAGVTAHLNMCEECWVIVDMVRTTIEEIEHVLEKWNL